VVEEVDAHDFSGLDEALGHGHVFGGGCRITGGVIVGDNDAGGGGKDGVFEDFAGVDEEKSPMETFLMVRTRFLVSMSRLFRLNRDGIQIVGLSGYLSNTGGSTSALMSSKCDDKAVRCLWPRFRLINCCYAGP
jgi:hypothetical protein